MSSAPAPWSGKTIPQFGFGTWQAKAVSVVLFGAANRPWDIDAAMRRRFGDGVYVPMPDAEARAALLKSRFALMRFLDLADDVDFDALSREMEPKHYSADDVIRITARVVSIAVRRFGRANFDRAGPVTLDRYLRQHVPLPRAHHGELHRDH